MRADALSYLEVMKTQSMPEAQKAFFNKKIATLERFSPIEVVMFHLHEMNPQTAHLLEHNFARGYQDNPGVFELRIRDHLLQEQEGVVQKIRQELSKATEDLSIATKISTDHLHVSPWSKGVNLLNPKSAVYRRQVSAIMPSVARAFHDGFGLAKDLWELPERYQTTGPFGYARGNYLRMCEDNFEVRRNTGSMCHEVDVMLVLAGFLHSQSQNYSARTQSNYLVPTAFMLYPDLGPRKLDAACSHHLLESSILTRDGRLLLPSPYLFTGYVINDICRELGLAELGLMGPQKKDFEKESDAKLYLLEQGKKLQSVLSALQVVSSIPPRFALAESLPGELAEQKTSMQAMVNKINTMFPIRGFAQKPTIMPDYYVTAPQDWDASPVDKSKWSFERQTALRIMDSPILSNTISFDTMQVLVNAATELYGEPTPDDRLSQQFLEEQLRQKLRFAQAIVKRRS
jgi:hypothetical protein